MERRAAGTDSAADPDRGPKPRLRPRTTIVTSLIALLAAVAIVAYAWTATPTGSPPDKDSVSGKPVPSQTPEPVVPPGVMPPDRTAAPRDPCATTPWPAGWIAAENKKPGDSGWRASFDPDRLVNGYLSQVSAACGDSVDLHLSGYVSKATITAYRMGWYGGTGGHVVWSAADVPVSPRPVAKPGPPTYTVEASWPTALTIKITRDWTPGFYLLVARAGGNGRGNAIPLVIRSGSGPSGSGTAPLLFQASVLTYQAYNTFGDYSLYNGPLDLGPNRSDRARVASFDRPYRGSGYEAPYLYDIPLVEHMEQTGLDVDYTTDIDVDQRPSQVLAHKALVIGGHSEYWTRRMYDAAEYARDHGVNLAFFGANTVYWHARLEPSPSGPDRRMVVYRVAAEDPMAKSDPSQATVEWRMPPLNRPEAGLVGADFGELGTTGGGFRVLEPKSWIFAGTGVTAGQVLARSLTGEFDTVHPEWPATPAGIDVIAAAPIMLLGQPAMATLSYYTAPSGGGVFSGGTTYWPCQVMASCGSYAVDPTTSRILATMTDNVLRSFAKGTAGLEHPSKRHLAPSAEALVGTAASPQDVAVRTK